ncbi:hypothetical protein CGK04_22675 [Vibrio parahaemolyticus]|uniref:hypothetical protein n=1 Tax=Vibrio parahaemolyticus TaxID=670 RepID=UPI001123A0EB|nr:hypothetical protein [Vibrio parahaemolyticus]TOB48403.1 hypothetical protein CGK04_22675 [Vibrio parahaemolyticus]TOI27772.1 hypothetical protein CGI64_11965 [Vibrio parahaemolyticus]HCE3716000.1 hypothetical protein [Vibrio parahaemolyticus]HCH1629674.1 hypothetical protein [Vibrio parahaemolyticus]
MSSKKTLNIKSTGSVVFLIILFIVAQQYGNELKAPLKEILESNWLTVVSWAYIAGTFIIHQYLYSSSELKKDSFIYKHFGVYADTLFGAATYGFAGTTSLALLKGLYLQTFYAQEYFIGFATFDLVSMFLLTSFLLVYCLFNISVMFKDILFYSSTSEVVVRK